MRETSIIDPQENNPQTLLELREGETALVTGITGGRTARCPDGRVRHTRGEENPPD